MAIKLNSGFEILVLSDLVYEEMTVEIQYQGEQLAQINRDKGLKQLEIEMYTDFTPPEFAPKFKFLLEDFLIALNEAKALLESLPNVPPIEE
jgi:hypothetical protein